jgi:hypothetical protein
VLAVQDLLEQEHYTGPVTLAFRFNAAAPPQRVCVVVEQAAEYRITVNGGSAVYAGLPCYFDRSFHPVDITSHVVAGENVIELTRVFEPPSRAAFALQRLFHLHTGVELEAIYLTGDFAVLNSVSAGPARECCTRIAPDFTLTNEPAAVEGDLTLAGYPFFAGRLVLAQVLDLPAPAADERVFLQLPDLGVPLVHVVVNDHPAGAAPWPPYRVEVTDWIRAGANRFEIELVTGLRNLLGPHHREQGEPDDTWACRVHGPRRPLRRIRRTGRQGRELDR